MDTTMVTGESFAALIDRWRSGDQEAADKLFRRFTGQLIALARERLDKALACKVDPEELVQSVYKSFLRQFRAGQCDFDNWDSFWGYLALLTVRKCIDRADYYWAACRDLSREEPLSENDDRLTLHAALARQPTPLEAAMLVEIVERLMAALEPRDRDILALHLQGYTIAEVSERLERAQRTVRRTIAGVKRRVRRQIEADRLDEDA